MNQDWNKEKFMWPEAFSNETGKSSVMPIITLILVIVGCLGFLGCIVFMIIAKDLPTKNLYQSALLICVGVIGLGTGGQVMKGMGDSKTAVAKIGSCIPDGEIKDAITKIV